MRIKYKKFKGKNETITVVHINQKCFVLPQIKLFKFIRQVLPYGYSVGLRDCDSGGKVFYSFPILAWNIWHLRKKLKACYGMGDGEVYNEIGVMRAIKWKWYNFKERKTFYDF